MPVIDTLKNVFSSHSHDNTDEAASEATTGATTAGTPGAPPTPVSAAPAPASHSAGMRNGADSDAKPRLPDQPVFEQSKITVVFVLGGPGAGELYIIIIERDATDGRDLAEAKRLLSLAWSMIDLRHLQCRIRAMKTLFVVDGTAEL